MRAARKWRAPATIASVFALITGALALTPGSAAASTHSCGTHTVVLEFESEPGKPKTKYKLPVKQIVTQGVSCTAAYKLLGALYGGKGGAKPEGYTCKVGKFKVPAGSVPEVCTKSGGKKVQFAGKGG
jgi:hypothetical protein